MFRTWSGSPRADAPTWSRLSARYSPLALWHLLSLDAPTVAALWTIFIAQTAGLTLHWTEPAAMFVAVWMIYAADRLLDARLLGTRVPRPPVPDSALWVDANLPFGLRLPEQEVPAQHGLEVRHRFHHRYRGQFLSFLGVASLALVLLLREIGSRTLHLYALLAALLAVWLLVIHAQPATARSLRHLPKELAVGLFFPAAVCIPTVALAPQLRPELLPVAALFAWLCTLNCLFLYAWEHPFPQPNAHWTTRWAIHHLSLLALLLGAVGGLLALSTAWRAEQAFAFFRQSALLRQPALACALSAALLLLLHRFRHRLTAVHLRASADLALLTPLLLLPFLRLQPR